VDGVRTGCRLFQLEIFQRAEVRQEAGKRRDLPGLGDAGSCDWSVADRACREKRTAVRWLRPIPLEGGERADLPDLASMPMQLTPDSVIGSFFRG